MIKSKIKHLKATKYLISGLLIFFSVFFVYAQFYGDTVVVRTVNIFPAEIVAEGWENTDTLTFQNLDEYALLQEFNSINSATLNTSASTKKQLQNSSDEDSQTAESGVNVEMATTTEDVDATDESSAPNQSTSTETDSADENNNETSTSSEDSTLESSGSADGSTTTQEVEPTPEDELPTGTTGTQTTSSSMIEGGEDQSDSATNSESNENDTETDDSDSSTTTVFRKVEGFFALAVDTITEAFNGSTSEDETEEVSGTTTDNTESAEDEVVFGLDEDLSTTSDVVEEPSDASTSEDEGIVVDDSLSTITSTSSVEQIDQPEVEEAEDSSSTTATSSEDDASEESVFEEDVTPTSTTEEQSEDIENSTSTEEVESEPTVNDCVDDCVPYVIELKNFGYPIDEGVEVSGAQLRVSMAGKKKDTRDRIPAVDVRYSTDDGNSWESGGSVTFEEEVSNSVNGGYFLFSLPDIVSEEDLYQLRVQLVYQDNPDILEDLYIESTWLELFTLEPSSDESPVSIDDILAENGFKEEMLSGDELTLPNGKTIEFTFTDDNTDETLIIKSSEQEYVGLSETTTYFSVTNTSDRSDTFQLQTYFPEGVGEVVKLQEWNQNKPKDIIVPEVRPFVYHCEAGWESTRSVDGESLSDISRSLSPKTESNKETNEGSEKTMSPDDANATSTESITDVTATTTGESAATTDDEEQLEMAPQSDIAPATSSGTSTSFLPQADKQTLLQSSFFDRINNTAAASGDEYICRNTNVIRACDSVDGDNTACNIEGVKVREHNHTYYSGGWETRDYIDGARPDPNIFKRFTEMIGFGPDTKEVPDDFEGRAHTDKDYEIRPGETKYFKMDIKFPAFSNGEYWVETIGSREYGLLDPFWQSAWTYRKDIELSNNETGKDLTEQQVLLEFDSSETDFWANVKSDGGDLRFVQQIPTPASTWYGIDPDSVPGWYDIDWSNRVAVTIPASTVNATLTDFPVFVDLSTLGTDFHTAVTSDGRDIRVTTSDGETEVPHELVDLDTGSETGELHFKADTILDSEDSVFYIYFGNATATAYAAGDTYGRNNVWTNGYEAVYHLNETGTGAGSDYVDSSGNNRDAQGGGGNVTEVPTPAASPLGTGQDFDGADDFITNNLLASGLGLSGTGNKSISLWSNVQAFNGGGLFEVGSNADLQDYSLRAFTTPDTFRVQHWGGGNDIDVTYSPAPNNWVHYALDFDGSNSRLFAGGGSIADAPRALNTGDDNQFLIGEWNGAHLDGLVDEVRIASVSRIAEWYDAENSNQGDPTNFYTVSTVESQPELEMEIGSWEKRIPIIIAPGTVDEDMTDFPVFVDLSTLGSAFFDEVESDGADIRVTAGDGDTQLPRHVANIDTVEQEGYMLFKAGSISATEETTFYIYYNNPTAATYADSDPYGAHEVWSDYAGIWRMIDGAGNNQLDTTNNNNTAIVEDSTGVSDITGFFGENVLSFTGDGNYSLTNAITDNSDRSFSMWYFKRSRGGGNYGTVFGSESFNDGIRHLDSDELNVRVGGNIAASTPTLANDTWHYVSFDWDGSNWTAQANGIPGTGSGTSWFSNDITRLIGVTSATNRAPDGIIRDMRVGPARSQAWREAEFLNQALPTSFYSTSSPQTEQPAPFIELDYWIQHFDYVNETASIWVQTELIKESGTTILEMYYGNEEAVTTSDRLAPFTYSQLRDIYYVTKNDATAPIRVVSLIDENQVQLDDGTVVDLDAGEITTFSTYSAGSVLRTLGPVATYITEDIAEGLSPISFATTSFAMPAVRGDSVVNVMSPFGQADVDLYAGAAGTPALSFVVGTGTVQQRTEDLTSVGVLEASDPVLMYYESGGSNSFTNQGDSTSVVDIGGVDYVVHTYTTTGTGSFTPPAGVTEIEVLAVGGGGGAGDATGGGPGGESSGGGGGAFAQSTLSVTPESAYTLSVAPGVGSLTDGNDTTFGTDPLLRAAGGTGGVGQTAGPGGTVADSIGDIRYRGGNAVRGGGGGAGTTGAGGDASGDTGGAGTTLYGGDGGAASAGNGNGSAGLTYGGGGGGARGNGSTGGGGSQGVMVVRYVLGEPGDAVIAYPPTTRDLFGVKSQSIFTSPLVNSVDFVMNCSDNTTDTVTGLDRGNSYSNSNCTSGTDGDGSAVRISGQTNALTAVQQDDGSGRESASFLPEKEWATEYYFPSDTGYVSVVCSPKFGTSTIEVVSNTGVVISSGTCTPADADSPGLLYFDGGNGPSTAAYFSGYSIRSTNEVPFYALYEAVEIDQEETNLFGSVQGRQFLADTLTVTVGDQEMNEEPVYKQTDFRWYENENSLTPTQSWRLSQTTSVLENDPIDAGGALNGGDEIRLRINLENVQNEAIEGSYGFKLQYAAAEECSLVPNNSWEDVGGAFDNDRAFRGYVNGGVNDGTELTSLLLSKSSVAGTYEDENFSETIQNVVPVGEFVEFDWVLEDYDTEPNTQYCFRMVRDIGTPFSDYINYPQLVTAGPPHAPTLFAPFDNKHEPSDQPEFEFSAVDNNGDRLDYQIQLSTDATFATTEFDTSSTDNPNQFTNLTTPAEKAPFTSGNRIGFAAPNGLSNGTTYFWRARVIDTPGSNEFSEWSNVNSFTINDSIVLTEWFQTLGDQFNTNTLLSLSTTSGAVEVETAGSAGTMVSTPIAFSDVETGNAWGEVSWNDTTTDGTIRYQVEYNTGGGWALVPDNALPGNSSGFTSSPIDILGLNTDTYSTLRLVADFDGTDLSVEDWRVTWGERVGTPSQEQPFDHEKVDSTQPVISFTATDPQGEDLEYEFSISASSSFAASTTYNSGVSSDFANLSNPADTAPFTSGDEVAFELPSALNNGDTYFWRVRARDPGGSNIFSPWSTPNAFTVDTLVDRSTWFQTMRDQFLSGELSGTEATTDNTVTVSDKVGEYGTIEVTNGAWTTVTTELTYSNPVVVTSVRYDKSTDIARSSRVRNKSDNSFDLRVANFDNSVGGTTVVDYVVMEEGDTYITDGSSGTRIVAGTTEVSTVVADPLPINPGGTEVQFNPQFFDTPAVFTTVTTNNDPSWVFASTYDGNDRREVPTASTLGLVLNRSYEDSSHGEEMVDYIAVEQNHGTNNGVEFESLSGPTSVTGSATTVSFATTFATSPSVALVQQASQRDAGGGYALTDTSGGISTTEHTVAIDSDGTSADRTSVAENTAHFAFASPSGILVREANPTTFIPYTNQGDNTSLTDISGETYAVHEYTTAGVRTFVPPEGVSEIEVLAVGGGAGAGNATGGGGGGESSGGGGGAFAQSTLSVTPLTSYDLVVGEGGSSLNDGIASDFGSGPLLRAAGGTAGVAQTPGLGGTVADSIGDITYRGGNADRGGGGGAGTAGAGGDATAATGGTGTGLYGGDGGDAATANGNGSDGLTYGGGGGGARGNGGIGGSGEQGIMIVRYSIENDAPTEDDLSGTFKSSPVVFADGAGPKFEAISWVDTVPGAATTSYQIEYKTPAGEWELIPDNIIPDNSTGLTVSPVSLDGVDVTTYQEIRLVSNLSCDNTDCPELEDWQVTWADGFAVSGTLRAPDRITPVDNGSVRVAVNGVLEDAVGTVSNGQWSVPGVTAFAGDVVTVYVENASTTGRAANVLVYDGSGDITGVELFESHFSLSSNELTEVTNDDIAVFDNGVSVDSDIFFDVDISGNLDVCAVADCEDFSLYIGPSNLYQPNNTSAVSVGTHDFINRGTVTLNETTLRVGGSWSDAGTVNIDESSVIFNATNGAETISNTFGILFFNHLTFGETSGSATFEPQNAFTVTGDLSVQYGTLLRERAGDITLEGDLLTGANGFWSGAGTTTLTGDDTVSWTDDNTSSQNVGNINLAGNGKTVNILSDVRATNITINANNTLRGGNSNTIEVAGNWTNLGTFAAQSSNVRMVDDPDGYKDASTESVWFDVDWTSRVEVTVPSGSVNTTLSDFPVYLDLSTMPATFWEDVASDGSDIRITAGDATSQVPVEVVNIDTVEEEGELHFRASTLSDTANTVFYVYFNNPLASMPDPTSPYGRDNVWTNGYEAVFHLEETGSGTAGEYMDSTGNGHDAQGGSGAQTPATINGVLGTAQDFTGADRFIESTAVASDLNMNGSTPKTITAWGYSTVFEDDGGIFSLGSTGVNGADYTLRHLPTSNNWRAQHWGGADHDFAVTSLNRWVHFALDYDGSASRVYADGVQASSNTTVLNTGDGFPASIGVWREANYFTGYIDEVRFASTNRSPEWYQAERLNQNTPTSFYDVAATAEEVVATPPETPDHTITTGGANFYDFTVADATTTVQFIDNTINTDRNFAIEVGTLSLPTERLNVGGSFLNTGGVFMHNNAEVRFTGSGSGRTIVQGVDGFLNEFYDLSFVGDSDVTFTETDHLVRNDLVISDGTVTFPSGELTLVGDVSVTSGGAFDANSGTVVFLNDGVRTASLNGSELHNVRIEAQALSSGWLGASTESEDWYDSSWSTRIPVTIQASEVDSTLTNYPVYIDLSLLGTEFFDNVKSDGGDIRVTTDNGQTELPVEIVSLATTTNQGELHFRADTISDTTDTTFYVYVGNDSASLPASDATYGSENVWSNGYAAVYHLNSVVDSTSNNRDLSIVGAPSQTESAYDFDGDNDRFELPTNFGIFDGLSDFTTEIRFNADAVAPGTDFATSPAILSFRGENDAMLTFGDSQPGDTLGFRYQGWSTPVTVPNIVLNTDYSIALTYDYNGSGLVMYEDGVVADTAVGNISVTTGSADSAIGAVDLTDADRAFDGVIYDVRISSVPRSQAWLSAGVTNINNVSSFIATGTAETYSTGLPEWNNRQPITIQSSQVAEAVTDFPVYVDLSDLSSGFFAEVNGDGSDIRVTEGDGVTEVPFELVSISTTTQTGELHFKATELSTTTNTTFYVYYGNENAVAYASGDTYGRENVWTNGYDIRYQMGQDPSDSAPQFTDSTNNNNDGTTYGSVDSSAVVTGQIGYGLELNDNGGTDFGTDLVYSGPYTISAWVDMTGEGFISGGPDGSDAKFGNWTSSDFFVRARNSGSSDTSQAHPPSGWNHVVIRRDGNDKVDYILNGGSPVRLFGDAAQVGNATWINVGGGTGQGLTGVVDEARFAGVSRSDGWITTEYNNQTDPSTFYQLGSGGEQFGTRDFVDTNVTVSSDFVVESGTALLPIGVLSVGGSFENQGAFDPRTGTVQMTGVNGGSHIVNPGATAFNNFDINAGTGTITVGTDMTISNDFTLTQANDFIVSSGSIITVEGTMSNSANNVGTDWTGSTLRFVGGVDQLINTKGHAGDDYGIVDVRDGAVVSAWNSTIDSGSFASSSSFYSQDNAGVDGDLYIYGEYERVAGTEHWSYATDFDSTDLTGGDERQVNVRGGSGASINIESSTLNILGDSSASTTIDALSGSFGIVASNTTLFAEHFTVDSLNSDGLQLMASSTINLLADGLFDVTPGNTGISIDASTIDTNSASQFFRVDFATTTPGTANNVTLTTGTPNSSVWFRDGMGNLYGEDYDDNDGNPGGIRWDDSSFLIDVSGTVYQDAGVTPPEATLCDGSTNNLRIVVDGGTYTDTTSCDAGGNYTFNDVAFIGDPTIVVYFDTNGGANGSVITKTPSNDITDLDIYLNRVMTRHEDASSLTISDMASYDESDDSDLRYVATDDTLDTLVVRPGVELVVASSTQFVPGGNVELQSGGNGNSFDGSLRLTDNATFTASGNELHQIGGSLFGQTNSTFSPASSTVEFTATSTGKTITNDDNSIFNFYELEFTGTGGSWNINDNIQVDQSLIIDSGVVTGTGDITIANGGVGGNGLLSMGGGTTTIETSSTLGGNSEWTFYNLALGNGSTVGTTTRSNNATTTVAGQLIISPAHFLDAGSSNWDLTGVGEVFVENGTLLEGTSTFTYSGDSSQVLSTNYYNLVLAGEGGAPTYTFGSTGVLVQNDLTVAGSVPTIADVNSNDPLVQVLGDMNIGSNGTFEASDNANLLLNGSYTNAGIFVANDGEIIFQSTDSYNVDAGDSTFSNVNFEGSGVGSIIANATSTDSLLFSSTSQMVVDNGAVLAVGGSARIETADTTWIGSTLYLYAGDHELNLKTTEVPLDSFVVDDGASVRTWNSEANNTEVIGTGSLYSQDHAGIDGDLYIYGSYTESSRSDHWSYATDFDGEDITGSERQATVYLADGASAEWTGGSLSVIGDPTASTTIQNQGSGTYSLTIGGTAATEWEQAVVRNVDADGLTFTGTPNVIDMTNLDLLVEMNDATTMTIDGSAITASPARNFSDFTFNSDTGVTGATNVTATGNTTSGWRFTAHSGNLDGEDYDDDPAGNPGYVIWDDSAAIISISGNVYEADGSTVSGVCDDSTANIALAVAGSVVQNASSSCASADGSYTINGVSFGDQDELTLYINGESVDGVTVSKDPVSSISDMDIYERHVVLRHEGNNPITINNVSVWDSSNDSDIPFTVSSGPNTMTVDSDTKLLIWSNKDFEPGGDIVLTGGGSGDAYDGALEIRDNGSMVANGSESYSIGGSLIFNSGVEFIPETSTIDLTSNSTGLSVTLQDNEVNNLTFSGTGSWTMTDTNLTVLDSLNIDSGSVILPTATTTIGGSFVNNGSFTHSSGVINMSSTDSGETITLGGSNVSNLIFTDIGDWTFGDTNATITGYFEVADGTVTLPSGTLWVGENFIVSDTVNHNSGTVELTNNSGTTVLTLSGNDLNSVIQYGAASTIMTDESATFLGDFHLQAGEFSVASNTLSIGGSLDVTNGVLNAATGTIQFIASDGGHEVRMGTNDFHNAVFSNPSGGWTLYGATTTNNFSLVSADSFTLVDGESLTIGGVFQNTVGGTATEWTNTTVKLDGGDSYSINDKTTPEEQYGTLIVENDTDVRVWNSSAGTTEVDSDSSLYSQDHGAVDGQLNIYGSWIVGTTSEYWSYDRDFDGSALSGGSVRGVSTSLVDNADVTVTGNGSLEMIGDPSATTTVVSAGVGQYTFTVDGGTINWDTYAFRDIPLNGIVASSTPEITSLANGDYEVHHEGGTALRLSLEALDANPSLTIPNTRFELAALATTGVNVRLSATSTNAWKFTDSYGDLAGEDFDVDGTAECGSIRWDDSSCLLTEQTEYRWRNDDGGLGVPDSEWFDTDFGYRQQVRVANNDTNTYNNIVVKLTVPYDSDMRSDFADLRFTAGDGVTPTDHLFERITPSSEAELWVAVPELESDSTAQLFMYYGSSTASSVSSSTAVFSVVDIFEDDNIDEYSGDTTKFRTNETLHYGGSYGLRAVTPSDFTDNGIARFDQTINQGETIRTMLYVSAGAGDADEQCTLFGVQSPVTANQNYGVCVIQFGTERVSLAKDIERTDTYGGATQLSSQNYNFTTTGWYEVEVDWKTDNTMFARVYNPDGNLIATTSASDSSYTSGGYGFTYWTNNGAWDAFHSRSLVDTKPSVFIGNKQQRGGATYAADQNTQTSAFEVGDTTRLRVAIENTGLAISDQEYQIEYAPKGVAPSCASVPVNNYSAVPNTSSCGTSDICMASSTNVANGESTSDLLLVGRNQFVAGEYIEDPSNQSGLSDLDQNNYTELEYALRITENVEDEAYCFRVTDNGDAYDSYQNIPELSLKFEPVVENVVLNGGNNISLIPGTTTVVYATGTVSDGNGAADLEIATSTIYRSGVTNGALCSADNNNCYISSTNNKCSFTECSGNSCIVECRADIYFHADPTDTGSVFEGEEWMAFIEVEDVGGDYDFGSAIGVDLNTVRAISVDGQIDYGTLGVNNDTGSFNASTSILNLGNVAADLEVTGTDLTDGVSSVIPASQQKFATSTFNYSACGTGCQLLSSSTPVQLDVDLTKPAVDNPPVADEVFWGIAVPFGINSAPHQGINVFTPVSP